MPFINEPQQQIALAKAIGDDDLGAADDFEFKEKLRAAYRLENTIGSFFSKEGNLPDSAATDPNFNPLDFATEEEKLDKRFLSNLIMADNTDEIEALRRQQARENEDRNKLAQGGFLPTAIAAVSDPVNLIPVGGTAYKTYRGGSSILNAGIVTAGAAATSTAATEAGLHYSQIQRTYGESAINIGAGTLFGGVLGATPTLVREIFTEAGHPTNKAFAEIEQSMDPEGAIANGENPTLSGELRSVGAAEVLTDVNLRGKLAQKVTKFLGFDPLSRTITSEAKNTRIASVKLAENPMDMDRNIGASVESNIKVHDGKMYEGITANNAAFEEYKAAGGVLARKDFNEAVGQAVRNGSDNEFIQKAADSWNKFVYEPLKKLAIEAKILPEDVSVTTAKNYLNRLWNKEKIASNLSDPQGNGFHDVVSQWLREQNPKMDAEQSMEIAREISGRIMSTPDGRLPYDYQMGENVSKGTGKSGLKGNFKSRTFDIPDALIDDFLENDIELLAARYVRNVAPDIELVRAFGDVNMTAEIKAIEQEWIAKIEAEPDPSKARKLTRQKNKDIRDIAAMRDRLRGVFSIPDYDNPWVRAARVARDLNYMRLLGGVVAASIPDVGRVVMAEGFTRTFGFALKPLVGNLSGFKMAANEAKLAAVGTDALLGGRSEIIADIADYAKGGTAFERGVRSAAQKFSSVNLMNFWTGGMKQLHAVMAQTRIAEDLLNGKIDKRLGQLGIDDANAENIARQIKRYGKKIDGVWVYNTKDWDSPALVEMWRAAMRKESDRVIVVPGQEKPLFMDNELGKTIFQFKSFMMSATQRILISGLQQQDAHMMQGMLSMMSLGAMSYAFKQWDAGRPIEDDPKTLVIEGIDRSGALGVLMELNNTMEKVSANNIGLRPLLGVDAPASRYASRSALDSMVGPTFGLAGDAIRVMGAATNQYEWSKSDTRALRRLLPYQNLSFIRQGFDKVEEQINHEIGVR